MAGERLPAHHRIPSPITPHTLFGNLPRLPSLGDGLTVNRLSTTDQGYPSRGQMLFMDERMTLHVPIGDFTTETQMWGALRGAQHLDIDDLIKERLVVVATEGPAKIIEGDRYFRRFPIIPAGLLENVVHLEKLQRYGVEADLGTQLGALFLKGLIFDRAIRSAVLDFAPDWDILYPIYPKGKSGKQPVRLADALARNPNSFYAHIVTTDDLDQVSVFPAEALAQAGKPGAIIYSALTRDDVWPTHRVMGRREFFDRIPLATGEHIQNLLTSLAAIELASNYKDKGVSIDRVFDDLGLQDKDFEPIGDMANDYNQVLGILAEVLFSNNKLLLNADADDYAQINQKLRETGNARLGQILPSLQVLLNPKNKIANVPELARARSYLFSRNWNGFSPELAHVLPANHRNPDALNTDLLIEALQQMLDATASTVQMPGQSPGLPNPIIDKVKEALRRRVLSEISAMRGDGQSEERITHLIQSNMRTWLTDAISETLRTADMFNARSATGRKLNYSPHSPEMQRFFGQAELYVSTHPNIVALEPFHQEAKTARPIYDYLAKLFPKDRIITGGNDPATLDTFRDAEGLTVEQDKILSFIKPEVREALGLSQVPDWTIIEKDKETDNLRRGIKNTKGDTILSLVLTGIATGLIHPDTDLMLSDSDFENPEGENGYYAAHALAGAKANQSPAQESIMTNIGRLGPQRRNHSVQAIVNARQNMGTALQRRIATNMNRLMWYLSGERVVKADLIMNHPFPNGYSMEVWLDLVASIEDYFNSDMTIAQIAVTTRKILNDAKPSKDWAMTQYCGLMLEAFFRKWEEEVHKKFNTLPEDRQRFLKENPIEYATWEKTLRDQGVMPTEWEVETLRAFNEKHAGRPFFITTPDEADEDLGERHEVHNFGNVDYFIPRDMLRPSIAKMDEMGWIDWEGIVEYIHSRGIKIDQAKLENAWWKQRRRERQTTQVAA